MSELFPDSATESKSPCLLWLEKWNLQIGQLPDGTRFCVGRNAIGYGKTHADAERECAEAMDVLHWSIEDFRKSGVMIPGATEEEVC